VLDINSLVSGISAIKRHQQAISSELNELKKSNEHLWKEAMASRERHKKHQDTINRILKFLAGVFGNSAASPVHKSDDGDSPQIDVHVPRKRQRLMIAAGRSGNAHARTASVTDDLDEDDDVNMGTYGELRACTHVNPYQTPHLPDAFAHITSPTPSASEPFTPIDCRMDPFPPPPGLSTRTPAPNQTPHLAQAPQPMNPAPAPQFNPVLPVHPFNVNTVNASEPLQNDMVQNVINQMMSSPQSMQRLVQALQNSNFQIQPPPSSGQPVSMGHPNNQLTTYSPAQLHFNFDHQDPTPNRPILLPAPPQATGAPAAAQPSSLIAPPRDELLPALNDQDSRLHNTWENAAGVADSINLMDSNIKSFMDQFGFDFDNIHNNDALANTTGSEVANLDTGNIDPADFDFQDLLNQFSNDGGFGDLGGVQLDPPVSEAVAHLNGEESKQDKETEKLTAFLGEVASDTASVRQLSPEAPIKSARKKRKSDVV